MREPLQAWISAQLVPDEMLWKGSWGRQMQFVRDTIVSLVGAGLDYEDRKNIAWVISTHRSKSIILPVYQLERPDLGLTLVLRNNFYNWKLSVISTRPIGADFSGLFHTSPPIDPKYTGDSLHPVYFEGFPENLIFGYFIARRSTRADRQQFSAEIQTDEDLYTTLFLLMRQLGAIKPAVWHTEASHRAEMDEAAARRKQREAEKAV